MNYSDIFEVSYVCMVLGTFDISLCQWITKRKRKKKRSVCLKQLVWSYTLVGVYFIIFQGNLPLVSRHNKII